MALRKDGPNIKPHAEKFTWEPGKEYECIRAASPGYKTGGVYKCYQNDRGYKCLMGRDGYEDLCTMLVSAFRVYDGNTRTLAAVT